VIFSFLARVRVMVVGFRIVQGLVVLGGAF
jgi:hypothetical protein